MNNPAEDIPQSSSGTVDDRVIQVLEEYATIRREWTPTGNVRISKSVTEETATVNIPIVNESYQVHHVPGSPGLLDAPPPALRREGDKTIISVVREVSVVVKKYELVEEIHITRHLTETPLTQEITLRKEHVQVTRTKIDQ